MGKCKHLIDISPYDPLCDHPCRLYGGGAVEAECETCQYHIEDLERENAKLRELVRTFYHCTTSGECDECPINGGGPVRLMPNTICDTIHDRMRELGVEV